MSTTPPKLLKDWNLCVSKSGLVFQAPAEIDQENAIAIYQQVEDWLGQLADQWGEVRLVWSGAKQGLRKFANQMTASVPTDSQGNLVIPELDLSLDVLYKRDNPVYLTEMSTQKVIWMNLEAMKVNHLARPSQMLNTSSSALWESNSMERMINHLNRDGEVPQFENIGYHWADHNGGELWRREKVATTSNYGLVTAWGVTCRMCETLSSEVITTVEEISAIA